MSKSINWGILGTGYIATEFARGLQSLPDARLIAIGSRSLNTAQAFANQFKVQKAYSSYEDLVADREVDVVYIATPSYRHKDDCILCLEAGKPILCEKPFTLSGIETQELINLARQKKLFCMEAMWMRFMPSIAKLQALIQEGVIGEIKTIIADFGVPVAYDPQNRFFNPKLGGGALLDRGIYGLSLAFMLLGKPSAIDSQAVIGESGVDEQSAITLSFPQGKLAILFSSLRTYTSNEATIIGDRGKIKLYQPFYRSDKLSLELFSQPTSLPDYTSSPNLKQKLASTVKQNALLKLLYFQVEDILGLIQSRRNMILKPYNGNGYNYEAAEVMKCLKAGELESKIMPLDETLNIMETIDIIRQQWQSYTKS